MIPPYLLYLSDCTDPIAAKTARGIAYWRPEWCIGQRREAGCTVDLGLPELTLADAAARGARTVVIGVANAGGIMPPAAIGLAAKALAMGLNVASGLHDRLTSYPDLVAAAARSGAQLFDVRQPPERLPIGTGRPRSGNRLLTVGTDCSVGKMYATLALERAMRERGARADFRATGQTGILIAGGGVPVDAVVADFISGAIEWLTPARDDGGWDLIEGQGSLFHPSYAGVSLGLIHGAQPQALLLCHSATRRWMRHLDGRPVPDLETCLERNLEAARLVAPHVRAIGVALNTQGLGRDAAAAACREIERRLGMPCVDPVADGAERLADTLLACVAA